MKISEEVMKDIQKWAVGALTAAVTALFTFYFDAKNKLENHEKEIQKIEAQREDMTQSKIDNAKILGEIEKLKLMIESDRNMFKEMYKNQEKIYKLFDETRR